MKKINALLLAGLAFLSGSQLVCAACDKNDMEKLRAEAKNIKISQDEMREILDKDKYSPPDGLTQDEYDNYVEYYSFFRVEISNLTENLYVTVKNKNTQETTTYTFENSKDGKVSFDWAELSTYGDFEVKIFSSNKTGCTDTKLDKRTISIPKYNSYSQYDMCNGAEDFYLCKKYIDKTTSTVSFERFVELLSSYKAGKVNNKGEEVEKPVNKKKNFFEEYKVAIIITGLVVIAIGGTTTVIMVKKQRSKKNEDI